MKNHRMRIHQVMAAYKRVRLNGAKPDLPDGLLRKEIYDQKSAPITPNWGDKCSFYPYINELAAS